MSIPVRCRCRVRIGDRFLERGCGAVRLPQPDGSWDWCFAPRLQAQDGTLCNVCGPIVEAEQQRALVLSEQGTERRIALGFGPGTGDAFEGFERS
jgi:hypothetical protein